MTTYKIYAQETGSWSATGQWNPKGTTKVYLGQTDSSTAADDMVARYSRIYKNVLKE